MSDTLPENMTEEQVRAEGEKLRTGRTCFWSDDARARWVDRLVGRAHCLKLVLLANELETLRLPRRPMDAPSPSVPG